MAEHELRADELELLAEVARQLDLVEALRVAVGANLVIDGKLHPALVELRQVRMELRRGLAQLAIPDGGVTGELPVEVSNLRTIKARKAARARWDRQGA